MKNTLSAPEGLREKLRSFVDTEEVPLEVVSDDDGTVRVVESAERSPCDSFILRPGGWITCSMARAMAARLTVNGRQMGKLLDLLDIKIRECELGCFG